MLLFNIMRRKNIVCEATHHHNLDGSNLWTRTIILKEIHLTGLWTSSSMPQTRSLFQVRTPEGQRWSHVQVPYCPHLIQVGGWLARSILQQSLSAARELSKPPYSRSPACQQGRQLHQSVSLQANIKRECLKPLPCQFPPWSLTASSCPLAQLRPEGLHVMASYGYARSDSPNNSNQDDINILSNWSLSSQ